MILLQLIQGTVQSVQYTLDQRKALRRLRIISFHSIDIRFELCQRLRGLRSITGIICRELKTKLRRGNYGKR